MPSPRSAVLRPNRWHSLVGRIVVTSVLLFAGTSGHALQALPASVVGALKSADIPTSAVSAYVQVVTAKAPLLSLNARTPMNPASVMKLVTTFAALDILGPGYTWSTDVLTSAPVRNGSLEGNLYLRGSGDPKLSLEQFWLLLRQLRARGLREIRGDVVLDRSLFDLGRQDPGSFDGQPLRAYNVIPDALLLNFKALKLVLSPNTRNGVDIIAEPAPAQLQVESRLEVTDTVCDNWRSGIRYEYLDGTESGTQGARLVFNGTYPRSCNVQDWSLAPLDHRTYDEALFRELWRELGGSFSGNVRDGPTPPDASPFAGIESPPVAEQIRDINKWSNNVMARQVFLSLGASRGQRPAHESDGEAAIKNWLATRGLDMPELTLENGAGLSRRERISAGSLARLLLAAWKSPVMPEFVASLPVMGVDGTLKRRNGETVGRAHIKGGTLDGVRTMAGYVLDSADRYVIVVFMVNHPNAENTRAAQDALLDWIMSRP